VSYEQIDWVNVFHHTRDLDPVTKVCRVCGKPWGASFAGLESRKLREGDACRVSCSKTLPPEPRTH